MSPEEEAFIRDLAQRARDKVVGIDGNPSGSCGSWASEFWSLMVESGVSKEDIKSVQGYFYIPGLPKRESAQSHCFCVYRTVYIIDGTGDQFNEWPEHREGLMVPPILIAHVDQDRELYELYEAHASYPPHRKLNDDIPSHPPFATA